MADDIRENADSSSVFFKRCYAFRSGNGFFALLILTLLGIGALWVSSNRISNPPDHLEVFVSSMFLVAGLGLLGCSSYVLYSILIDRQKTVRISVDGIWRDKNCTPWNEVAEFYGTQYRNGISLGFASRHKRIHFEKSLSTTPPLTDNEYRDLMIALHEYLHRINSGVKIALHPRVPIGD